MELAELGINYIAPPTWMLVTVTDGRIVPSAYARDARAAALKIFTWTPECSGPLVSGGRWSCQSIADLTRSDAMALELLHALARDVGIGGIFSDRPATVTRYANCMGLNQPLSPRLPCRRPPPPPGGWPLGSDQPSP